MNDVCYPIHSFKVVQRKGKPFRLFRHMPDHENAFVRNMDSMRLLQNSISTAFGSVAKNNGEIVFPADAGFAPYQTE
jgi:hypothetical protein